MEYIAVMVPEGGGGFSVLFPDLPGCVTQAGSFGEAVALATEAAAVHVATLRELGRQVRPARGLDTIRADVVWAQENAVDWRTAKHASVRV